MSLLSRIAVTLAILFGFMASARAEAPAAFHWTPEQVATAIKKKAEVTSFGQLDSFGLAALHQPAPERLNRLHHVAWILLNQSEFERSARWDAILRAEARKAGSRRFIVIADLDLLRARYDQGDSAAGRRIEALARIEPDWFARADAMSSYAYVLVKQGKDASALKVLADAGASVPTGDLLSGTAAAQIWEIEGLALMDLQDLDGGARAFGRAQFEYTRPDYPRPDFDGLYDMASLAARLGRQDLAQQLYLDHHKLALRSDLPALRIWDRNICARVAEGRDAPQAVLACFEGLDGRLGAAAFLAPQILPARAIAYARLGRIDDARSDLEALYRLQRSKAFENASFERTPQVEAEVLHAEGDDPQAYETLRHYAQAHANGLNQRFSAGIGQMTQEMAKELDARRVQLATAQRDSILQRDVIRTQGLLVTAGCLVGPGVIGLLVWQWKVAGELRDARRKAEAASQAKSEFLANMSHEIRTPLNGVVAVADMLAKSDLPTKEREMVEIIRSSGDTLQRLLSDILDLARIESGKITIDAAPFHLGDLVRDVGALSKLRCDERGIRLDVQVPEDLDGFVLGDIVRVRQVLTNFMSNALKFTERGTITLAAEPTTPGRARLTVKDTGVGFDPADKQRILGRFQQADSSITRRFGGSGLGLAICCELAGLMQGVLDCDSALGVGSTFWIEIPLPTLEGAAACASAAGPAASVEADLRILLADDHPTNRKVVELMLAGTSVELFSVENGLEALEAFRQQAFDIVLMDMQMPVMDGLTAVREIRRWETETGRARTPIMMLTANALPEHVAEAEQAGAERHLSKPFTVDALFEAIEDILGGCETAATSIAA